MAKLYDLARMTTATVGTGTITLGSVVPPFLSFANAGVQNGDSVSYAILDGANSEVGRGTYTSSGTTLTRGPLVSTNSNSAISLSGTAQVFISGLAEDFTDRLLLAGGTMTGLLTLSGDPSTALQAVTKQYADAIAAGLDFKNSCYCATIGALTVTYNNGASGVGATLTNAGAQAAFSIDGQSPAANSRVLVKNQGSAFQNGIYTLTTVGTGSTNWVLTRATDYNLATQIAPGDLVPVEFGTINAGSVWLETAAVTTVGTDSITFSSFIQPGLYALVANNLSDLASVSTARTNLGLGDSATKNVGTTTGTVAAGDDSRITGAVQKGTTGTLTVGYTFTANSLGNITSFTIDPSLGNYQYGTNHAAATWTAPTSDCAVDIYVVNDATAGTITFSGFTVGSSTGDTLTTTNGNKFIISIRRINAVSTYIIKALQ